MADYFNPGALKSPIPSPRDLPGIRLPQEFALESADRSLTGGDTGTKPQTKNPPITQTDPLPTRSIEDYGEAIARLAGAFSGPGFNLIFRPHADKDLGVPEDLEKKKLKKDDLLELNLTHELWTFPGVEANLGKIPNRVAGFTDKDGKPKDGRARTDVNLHGIPYTQLVRDVTQESGVRIPVNRLGLATEVRPKDIEDIHFEAGLLIHVPTSLPVIDKATITRMASIPHGTTINAQGMGATKIDNGQRPVIPFSQTASKPFSVSNSKFLVPDPFVDEFDVTKIDTATRLPQNLTKFTASKSITQGMLQDPNELINKHNDDKTFKQVIQFTVSTVPDGPFVQQACPHLAARNALRTPALINSIQAQITAVQGATSNPDVLKDLKNAQTLITKALAILEQSTVIVKDGDTSPPVDPKVMTPATGTANIAFLDGTMKENDPNARTGKVISTFWISTVEWTITVSKNFLPNSNMNPILLDPDGTFAPGTVPRFVFPTDQAVTAGKYKVLSTQVQYSQTVNLIFNNLVWPHISVATLVPVSPVLVNFAKRVPT